MQGVDRTRRAYPPWQISARRFLEQDIEIANARVYPGLVTPQPIARADGR